MSFYYAIPSFLKEKTEFTNHSFEHKFSYEFTLWILMFSSNMLLLFANKFVIF